MFENDTETTHQTAKRRVYAQSLNILRQVVDSYMLGELDDPVASHRLCTLLALVAEGKVTSSLDEHTGKIKWSLNEDYRRKIEETMASSKIVRGPWGGN
tara:strand:+ start:20131 stop:20427 length:297 start_codon:yes stop_codon:yes gene_type:complete